MLKADDFFDLVGFQHAELFVGTKYVWEALVGLEVYLKGILLGGNTFRKARIAAQVAIVGTSSDRLTSAMDAKSATMLIFAEMCLSAMDASLGTRAS
jgi:hypothetical protein